jgi:hypothetical protein
MVVLSASICWRIGANLTTRANSAINNRRLLVATRSKRAPCAEGTNRLRRWREGGLGPWQLQAELDLKRTPLTCMSVGTW